MLGGIRHFIWDTGYGFGAQRARVAGARRLSVGSIVATIVLWVIGYAVMGGAR